MGRLLIVMMIVGALRTLDEHDYVWAASFLGAALLAWLLLRRWRGPPTIGQSRLRLPRRLAWHDKSADEITTLCERRIGLQVDAAAPATISSSHVFGYRTAPTRMEIVTSDGHALTRLQRALERGTAQKIGAIVAELPRPPGLEDALAICLALLDREPETYARAAAKWASRFAIERRVTLTDAQLALSALGALSGDSARAGAEPLIEL